MGNDGEKIIPQRLADRMESSGLKGARYKPVKAVSFYEGSGFRANIKSTNTPAYDTDLVSLIFTGSSCLSEWEALLWLGNVCSRAAACESAVEGNVDLC